MHAPSLSISAWLIPLLAFVLVSSITPGPNNTMLTASGLNHGFKRSLPHMLGVSLGFGLMLLMVGLGIGTLLLQLPWLYTLLQVAGTGYLIYLAWKIAHAGLPQSNGTSQHPLRYWQAMLFQWVNPKVWIMVVGILAAYVPRDRFFIQLPLAALLCTLVNFPCIALWTGCGSMLRRWLYRPAVLRGFNLLMALLLLSSVYPLLTKLVGTLRG